MFRRTGVSRLGRLLMAVGALGALTSACSSPRTTSASTGRNAHHAIGLRMETLVDHSRSTPANATAPGHPGRILATTILYPATGTAGPQPVTNATPDRADGPYPLIVFAHGFGSNVESYLPLLERWAAAGFVVAAPLFPLTNTLAPGGPDLSDYIHQPGDMSFVVTQVLRQSSASGTPLSGLVNPSEVGAAGHSLGGVTTLGLVANSCCRDNRIRAAVVMSGDPITFTIGQVEDGDAPPLLLIHGNADPTVPSRASTSSTPPGPRKDSSLSSAAITIHRSTPAAPPSLMSSAPRSTSSTATWPARTRPSPCSSTTPRRRRRR